MPSTQRTDILALNAGSSSLKFALFRPSSSSSSASNSDPDLLASGSIKLTSSSGTLSIKPSSLSNGSEISEDLSSPDITSPDLLSSLLQQLAKAVGDDYNPEERIAKVTHRIVHGGEEDAPVVVRKGEEQALKRIEALAGFAPLHNFTALQVVHNTLTSLPFSPSLLYFDTTFHSTLPLPIRTYPLPSSPPLPGNLSLRRYGFHGLSYAFILSSVSTFLSLPTTSTSLIVAHLGSGASACAIKHGQSLDTSMGLTPLEGLPGSTRAGTVDPSLGYHLSPLPDIERSKPTRSKVPLFGAESWVVSDPPDDKETFEPLVEVSGGHKMSRAEWLLNKKSGYGALAGTGDFGEITKRVEEGERKGWEQASKDEKKAKLAYEVFEDRLIGFLGSYYLKIVSNPNAAKLDALVFSGGIGEKSTYLREQLAKKLEGTPLQVKGGFAKGWKGKLEGEGPVYELGGKSEGEGVRWLVCETDEELQMARQALDWKE